jgi:hypothetical protein
MDLGGENRPLREKNRHLTFGFVIIDISEILKKIVKNIPGL